MSRSWSIVLLASGLLACAPQSPGTRPARSQLAVAESLYADLRDVRDQIDIALTLGHNGITDATPLRFWIMSHNELRRSVASRLGAVDSTKLREGDRRALSVMRRTMAGDIDSLVPPSPGTIESRADGSPSCGYDPRALLAQAGGLDSLRSRLYACYGWAQSHVVVGTDTLDRLTILGALGRTAHSVRRRQLFLALEPVWRSVNAANTPRSPYRLLIAEEGKQRKPGLPSLLQSSASEFRRIHWSRGSRRCWTRGAGPIPIRCSSPGTGITEWEKPAEP